MVKSSFMSIIIRYSLLLLLGLGSLWFLNLIITPLTIGLTYYILGLLVSSSLSGVSINLLFSDSSLTIILVDACIAVSAYYLLIILNLSTPMGSKKHVKSLSFTLLAFYLFNVLRIVIFSLILHVNFNLFVSLHLFFWYIMSFLVVSGLWFLTVKLFSIDNIPFFDDIKLLFSAIHSKKRKIKKRTK